MAAVLLLFYTCWLNPIILISFCA